MSTATSFPGPGQPEPESINDRKGWRTRRKVLCIARRMFAQVGYERATIRAIAAAARVDKSSVIKHFGTKERLFREAVDFDLPMADGVTNPAVDIVEFSRAILTWWSSDTGGAMAALHRASMTSELAADILRQRVSEQITEVLAPSIAASDSRLRAALVGAILLGVASQRYLSTMSELKECEEEEVLRLLAIPMQSLTNPYTTDCNVKGSRPAPRRHPT